MSIMNDAEQGYAWESEYEKTWEIVQEDEGGSLETVVKEVIQKNKRKIMMMRMKRNRIGMMRNIVVLLDNTKSMEEQDLRPNRLHLSIRLLEKFLDDFFDQNPISQLSLVALSNRRAHLISPLSGNGKQLEKDLKSLLTSGCHGETSLYNGLLSAFNILKQAANHVSKEVLLIYGALSTVDPFDLDPLVKEMKNLNIKVSIIGLSASMHICQSITKTTNGRYDVILDESHYKSCLDNHLLPPLSSSSEESSLVRMGFPQYDDSLATSVSYCLCHMDKNVKNNNITGPGYLCPQCGAKYCQLPVQCSICSLTLASSAHLARSYHHLFPLPLFQQRVTTEISPQLRYCHGCQINLENPNCYRCKKCDNVFCTTCDLFIHEQLHTCPGCATIRCIFSNSSSLSSYSNKNTQIFNNNDYTKK